MATRAAPAANPTSIELDINAMFSALEAQTRLIGTIHALLSQGVEFSDPRTNEKRELARAELIDELWQDLRSHQHLLGEVLKGVEDVADLASETQKLLVYATKRIDRMERQANRDRGAIGLLLLGLLIAGGIGSVVHFRQMDRLEKRTRYLVHNQLDTQELTKELRAMRDELAEVRKVAEAADRHVLMHDARFEEFGDAFLTRVETAIELRDQVH